MFWKGIESRESLERVIKHLNEHLPRLTWVGKRFGENSSSHSNHGGRDHYFRMDLPDVVDNEPGRAMTTLCRLQFILLVIHHSRGSWPELIEIVDLGITRVVSDLGIRFFGETIGGFSCFITRANIADDCRP